MGSKVMQIDFHQDAGHGWFAVPHHVMVELKLPEHISKYSYMDKDFAYLEEDADRTTFEETAEDKGFEYSVIKVYDGNESFIRSLATFDARKCEALGME